nr:MAG TPA: hypothetical protein [Caudoviricetes sp.]
MYLVKYININFLVYLSSIGPPKSTQRGNKEKTRLQQRENQRLTI